MSKGSKVLKVIGTVRNTLLTVALVAMAALVALILFTRLAGGTPSLFGYSIYRVSSGSMTPSLEIGDVILSKETEPEALKESDIVTYNGTSGDMKGKLVTHRIVKAPFKKKGETYVITKGDANTFPDDDVNVKEIRGVMVSKVDILTAGIGFFLTPWGLLCIIFLIILAFFNEIVNLVRAIVGGPEPKGEDVDDIIERYKKENAPEKTEPDSGND